MGEKKRKNYEKNFNIRVNDTYSNSSSNKLPTSNVQKENNTLPITTVKKKESIIFSYKYFKCNSLKSKEFNNCFKNQDDYAKWITFYLKRIAEISTMKIGVISSSGSTLRFHPVEDNHLIKLKSILKSMDLDVDEVFNQNESQNYYELSMGTGNGRMFGYLIENIYFLLLLDPNHLVYMNASKGAKNDLYYKNYDPWYELLDSTNELRR